MLRIIEYLTTLGHMRKLSILFLLVVPSILLVIACGGSDPAVDPTSVPTAVPTSTQVQTAAVASTPTYTPSREQADAATTTVENAATSVPDPTATLVQEVSEVSAASVTVRAQISVIVVGQTQQLSFAAKDAAGNVLSGITVTWSSSDSSTATVSGTGMLTGVAPGSSTITATSGGMTGTGLITVADTEASSVTVSPDSATLATGQTYQLSATLKDGAGNILTGLTVAWSSSNSSVASVSATGLVTGIASGSTTITATSDGVIGTSVVTVAEVPVTSVTVSPQSTSLPTGQTQQLMATLRDSTGNVLSGITVTWSSSNQSAATVSDTGLVTGIAPGSSTITATSGGMTWTGLITVTDIPLVSVVVNPPLVVLIAGQTRQLTASLTDATGTLITDLTVTWTSSDPSVATVSSTGLIRSIGWGTATITATSDGISGTTTIEVVIPY